MTGIDEREEYDETSHQSSGNITHANPSSRASMVKNYNFGNFFTPSQSSKRMAALETNFSNKK